MQQRVCRYRPWTLCLISALCSPLPEQLELHAEMILPLFLFSQSFPEADVHTASFMVTRSPASVGVTPKNSNSGRGFSLFYSSYNVILTTHSCHLFFSWAACSSSWDWPLLAHALHYSSVFESGGPESPAGVTRGCLGCRGNLEKGGGGGGGVPKTLNLQFHISSSYFFPFVFYRKFSHLCFFYLLLLLLFTLSDVYDFNLY